MGEENCVNFLRIASSCNPYWERTCTFEFALASALFVSWWWSPVQCHLLQDAIADPVTLVPGNLEGGKSCLSLRVNEA